MVNLLPPVGARVFLAEDIDRFSDFLAKAGRTGIVVHATDGEHDTTGVYAVRMDQPLSDDQGTEIPANWNNEIHWYPEEINCGLGAGYGDALTQVLPI